jgi:hypothetical protein
MEGPNGERVVVGRPTGVAGGFLPERLEQLGQEGVRVVDDPEQSGKGTVALRTGARGRPPKVRALAPATGTHAGGRPRSSSFPLPEELATPSVYKRTQRRFEEAVAKANENEAIRARLARTRAELAEAERHVEEQRRQLVDAVKAGAEVPLHVREWVRGLVVASGLPATNLPLVDSLYAIMYVGKASAADLAAVNTCLSAVRTAGAALLLTLARALDEVPCFFVQNDQSGRAHLQLNSFTVSYWDKERRAPVVAHADLDLLPGKTAPLITKGVVQLVSELEGNQGQRDLPTKLAGFGSDNTVAMTGANGGVGVLLCKHFDVFLRHDTCQDHIHALLLAQFATVFGHPKMDTIGVLQWLYLLWYICNKDWPAVRTAILRVLKERYANDADNLGADLEPPSLDGEDDEEADHSMPGQPPRVTKVKKPSLLRWDSYRRCALWAQQLLPVLKDAFTLIWSHAREVPEGSLAALSLQWLDWARSEQLQAQFAVFLDWCKLLAPFSTMLHTTTPHGFDGQFGAPVRLRWYIELNTVLDRWREQPTTFPSYKCFLNLYNEDGSSAWQSLAVNAEDRLEGNLLYTWCGIYALDAAADPVVAPRVVEALVHLLNAHGWVAKQHPDLRAALEHLRDTDFAVRTKDGSELQTWMLHPSRVTEQHKAAWWALVTPAFVAGLVRLYSVLRNDGIDAFLNAFLAPSATCPVVNYFQSRVFPVLTSTMTLEGTFAHVDNQSRAHGLLLKKEAGEAAHATGRPDTLMALARTRGVISSTIRIASREHQEERGLSTDRPSQAKAVIIRAAELLVERSPSSQDWEQAKQKRSGRRAKYRRGALSASGSDTAALDVLLAGGVKRQKADNDALSGTEVPLVALCFADGACKHNRQKTRGRQSYIECGTCGNQFYASCALAANLITKTSRDGFQCAQTTCRAPSAKALPADTPIRVAAAANADSDDDVDGDEIVTTPVMPPQVRQSVVEPRSEPARRGQKRSRRK